MHSRAHRKFTKGPRMKIAPRVCALLALAASALTACVYAPFMQSSFAFDRHPGVSMETWWQYDAGGYGYPVTLLVNRSGVDKCAWTAALPSRVLHPGETWPVAQGQSPGAVGISNVLPADPNCANAKQTYGTTQQ